MTYLCAKCGGLLNTAYRCSVCGKDNQPLVPSSALPPIVPPNKRPYSDKLAQEVIEGQVKEIDRLTKLVQELRSAPSAREPSGMAMLMEGRSRLDRMVDRFLSWPLPKTFAPDCGISFKPLNHPNAWPIGTNLFTADEARAMLEHVLAQRTESEQPIEWACKEFVRCKQWCGNKERCVARFAHERPSASAPAEEAPKFQAIGYFHNGQVMWEPLLRPVEDGLIYVTAIRSLGGPEDSHK